MELKERLHNSFYGLSPLFPFQYRQQEGKRLVHHKVGDSIQDTTSGASSWSSPESQKQSAQSNGINLPN